MRTLGLIVVAVLAAGCGSNEPPQAESPSNGSAQSPLASNDPNRRLTQRECESMAQAVVDACNNRGNDRSTEADGWCSEMLRRNAEGGTWVQDDCVPHFKYMDSFCFGGAGNAHGMMVCDRTVDRSR